MTRYVVSKRLEPFSIAASRLHRITSTPKSVAQLSILNGGLTWRRCLCRANEKEGAGGALGVAGFWGEASLRQVAESGLVFSDALRLPPGVLLDLSRLPGRRRVEGNLDWPVGVLLAGCEPEKGERFRSMIVLLQLSVKLLRYMNSSMVGLRTKVDSIKQALALIGERPLKQWASLVALTSLAEDKTAELVTVCLVPRSR